MNQFKSTEFQVLGSVRRNSSDRRFTDLQEKFKSTFKQDEQQVFALVLLGSFARSEMTRNSDRDSVLIFSDSTPFEKQESIRMKCISIFDLNKIPVCTGGMGIDSKDCSKTMSEWRLFFSSFNKKRSVRDIIFLDTMRNQRLLCGNLKLLKSNQELLEKAVLSSFVTEILIAEGFFRIFFNPRIKHKFFFQQISKFNYLWDEHLVVNQTVPKGLLFLHGKGIIQNEEFRWLEKLYATSLFDEKEKLTFFDQFRLRFIILRLLSKILMKRILG